MTPHRARRVLLAAFAISLLLHLVFALWVRRVVPPRDEVVAVTALTRPRVLRMLHARPTAPPHSPPPVTPSPQPSSASQHQRIAKPARIEKPTRIAVPSSLGRSARTHAVTSPRAQPSSAPSSRPLPCAGKSLPATLAVPPTQPDIPVGARDQGTTGTASVLVHLDGTGAVRDASVVGSSGNGSLDLVALQMARTATYAPARVNCTPVAGSYTFSARFVAW